MSRTKTKMGDRAFEVNILVKHPRSGLRQRCYTSPRIYITLHFFLMIWIITDYLGNQPGRLGEYHVLRARRPFLLGLDIFCRANYCK